MPDYDRQALRDFIEQLVRLREDAGAPSLPRLRRLSEQTCVRGAPGLRVLAVSTTSEILNHKRAGWPEWGWVASFVTACRAAAENAAGVEADKLGDLAEWKARFSAARSDGHRYSQPDEPTTSRRMDALVTDEAVPLVARIRARPYATDWAASVDWTPGAVAAQPGEEAAEPAGLTARGGPVVLRLVLGTRLRQLREDRRISREDAAAAIQATAAKISRLERGRIMFRERDMAELLTLYGVVDESERAGLLSVVNEANSPGWWHTYGGILPDWFETYLGLEEAAARIRTYAVQFVPDLLQTPDYARAAIELGHPDAPADEIDRRVDLRMRRQRLLTRAEPLTLWAVLDETALRRPIGGRRVMRAQLLHLIEVAALPNVTLNVFPFRTSGYAACTGPFSILRFTEPELPDVVYLEQLTGAVYLDRRTDLDHYALVMERLCAHAHRRAATVGTLHTILTEL